MTTSTVDRPKALLWFSGRSSLLALLRHGEALREIYHLTVHRCFVDPLEIESPQWNWYDLVIRPRVDICTWSQGEFSKVRPEVVISGDINLEVTGHTTDDQKAAFAMRNWAIGHRVWHPLLMDRLPKVKVLQMLDQEWGVKL